MAVFIVLVTGCSTVFIEAHSHIEHRYSCTYNNSSEAIFLRLCTGSYYDSNCNISSLNQYEDRL